MLDLEFAQASDCGRVRDHNEDYLGYVLPEVPEQEQTHGWLFALADGVGGQQSGEVASRTAVETLLAGGGKRCARGPGGRPAANSSGRYCRVWFRQPMRRSSRPG